MKTEKSTHPMWLEAGKIREKVDVPIGNWRYILSSHKGKISLISLPNYFMDGKTLWEIYCLSGNLFEDVERFDTKEEAEKRIEELLE
jgi:hypothetical protein